MWPRGSASQQMTEAVWAPSFEHPAARQTCVAYLSMAVQDATGLDAYREVSWNGEAWETDDEILGVSFVWVPDDMWPCPPPRG